MPGEVNKKAQSATPGGAKKSRKHQALETKLKAQAWKLGHERKPAKRFLDKVKLDAASGCLLWTAAADSWGYGAFWQDGKVLRAHRASYDLFCSAIPEGLLLRHTCDTRLCVHPDHLLPGTIQENAQDFKERGESYISCPDSTPGEREAIHGMHRKLGHPQRLIAKWFHMSPATVCLIIQRVDRELAQAAAMGRGVGD